MKFNGFAAFILSFEPNTTDQVPFRLKIRTNKAIVYWEMENEHDYNIWCKVSEIFLSSFTDDLDTGLDDNWSVRFLGRIDFCLTVVFYFKRYVFLVLKIQIH